MPKAVQFEAYGGVEVLRVRDVARPRPGAAQVLVAVRAAGINPSEGKIREGLVRAIFPRTKPATDAKNASKARVNSALPLTTSALPICRRTSSVTKAARPVRVTFDPNRADYVRHQFASVPSKSIVAWVPSQNGLFDECPQRHIAIGSGCSITCPSGAARVTGPETM
jgi:hypothetical protein